MLTKAFNCPKCERPFASVGQRPFYSIHKKEVYCRECAPNPKNVRQRGMIEFLSQRAFKCTSQGYEYTLPIADPVCVGCNGNIKVIGGARAIPTHCGHYLCQGCVERRQNGIVFSCKRCNTSAAKSADYPENRALIKFYEEIRGHSEKTEFEQGPREDTPQPASATPTVAHDTEKLTEMLKRSEQENKMLNDEVAHLQLLIAKKEENQRSGGGFHCTECEIRRPVERLYICEDCDRIICGDCNFDSHQIHSVSRILGTALDQLREKYDERYTETIEGIAINLESLQKNVNEAVRRVLIAGKERLSLINQSSKYEQAEKIVNNVETTTELLEKHCHEYFPAARKLATRLEELELLLKGEEI